MNAPVALVVALLAPRLLPAGGGEQGHPRLDLPGAVTVTAGLSLLVFALVGTQEAGWISVRTIGFLLTAAVLLGVFVVIEIRSPAPLVHFRFFRMRVPTVANIALLIFGAGMFSMLYFLSLYMQQALHYPPLAAGLAFLPQAAA